MPTISINGNSISYESANPDSQALPLIFVHGAGGSSHKWLSQLAYLAGSYKPLAVDLPGHGRSGGQGARDIADYREFIKSFAEALNLGPFVLAGHSMGGAITLDFARQYPEMLKGIILVGTGAKLRVAPDFLEFFRQGNNPPNFRQLAYSAKTPDEVFYQGEKDYKLTGNEIRYGDFLACDSFDIRASLAGIKLPALIICGDEDVLTPAKYSEYLQANLPLATMDIIPNAGHMVMIEQPDAVNTAIDKFLQGLNR